MDSPYSRRFPERLAGVDLINVDFPASIGAATTVINKILLMDEPPVSESMAITGEFHHFNI